MKFPNQPSLFKQSLSNGDLCKDIEQNLHTQVKQGCLTGVRFLKSNTIVEELLPSVSALLHILFYQLNYETKVCITKEQKELFPAILQAELTEGEELERVFRPYKNAHKAILQLLGKTRQILSGFELKPNYSKEFSVFITEFKRLENNMYSWIHVEEDLLFPKLVGDAERSKYIATVFR